MKKIYKLLLTLGLSLSLLIPTSAFAATISDSSPYQFQVKGGTEEWSKFTTHDEMLASTQIPEDKLKKMSTEALLATALDYPLFGDIYAYNSIEEGIKAVAKQFNGFSELFNRKDAGDVIIKEYKSLNISSINQKKTNSEKGESIAKLKFIEELLNNDDIISLTDAQKKVINNELSQKFQQKLSNPDLFGINIVNTNNAIDASSSNMTLSDLASSPDITPASGGVYTTDYVYTPNGSAVEVWYYIVDLTQYEKDYNKTYVQTYYPSATVISEATIRYNCHSYAWYSRSYTLNRYWMNYPDAYMNDGSSTYLGTTPSIYISGLRMYYPGLHSAYMTGRSGTSSSYSDITCTSKWGQLPLMSHKANYCPYNSSIIKFYSM